MKKSISILLVTILAGALLIYSATRSIDFISMTLPPDRQILAWFGLAALDGGLVFWLLHFLYGASGAWQRGISILMIIVDFIGAVAMFTLDTLYNTGEAGLTTALSLAEIQTAILALSAVIALNIAATIANHISDPDNMRKMAEEEAFDEIESLALRNIQQQSKALAAELAPQLALDWMNQTRITYKNRMIGSNKPDALIIPIEKPERSDEPIPEFSANGQSPK